MVTSALKSDIYRYSMIVSDSDKQSAPAPTDDTNLSQQKVDTNLSQQKVDTNLSQQKVDTNIAQPVEKIKAPEKEEDPNWKAFREA